MNERSKLTTNRVVYFDGACNFCNGTVDFFWKRNRSRNLYYSSLQSAYAKNTLAKLGIEKIDLKTLYYVDGEDVYEKGEAVLRILTNLEGWYPFFGRMAQIIPNIISNSVYDVISKYRYKIIPNKYHCRIPSKSESIYFLK
ncbi:MAG: DUF393 domain-containing protein [Reichenbachiella sp.]